MKLCDDVAISFLANASMLHSIKYRRLRSTSPEYGDSTNTHRVWLGWLGWLCWSEFAVVSDMMCKTIHWFGVGD
jgi:hypothetical protein